MTKDIYIARKLFKLDDLNDKVREIAIDRNIEELEDLTAIIEETITQLARALWELADIVKWLHNW